MDLLPGMLGRRNRDIQESVALGLVVFKYQAVRLIDGISFFFPRTALARGNKLDAQWSNTLKSLGFTPIL